MSICQPHCVWDAVTKGTFIDYHEPTAEAKGYAQVYGLYFSLRDMTKPADPNGTIKATLEIESAISHGKVTVDFPISWKSFESLCRSMPGYREPSNDNIDQAVRGWINGVPDRTPIHRDFDAGATIPVRPAFDEQGWRPVNLEPAFEPDRFVAALEPQDGPIVMEMLRPYIRRRIVGVEIELRRHMCDFADALIRAGRPMTAEVWNWIHEQNGMSPEGRLEDGVWYAENFNRVPNQPREWPPITRPRIGTPIGNPAAERIAIHDALNGPAVIREYINTPQNTRLDLVIDENNAVTTMATTATDQTIGYVDVTATNDARITNTVDLGGTTLAPGALTGLYPGDYMRMTGGESIRVQGGRLGRQVREMLAREEKFVADGGLLDRMAADEIQPKMGHMVSSENGIYSIQLPVSQHTIVDQFGQEVTGSGNYRYLTPDDIVLPPRVQTIDGVEVVAGDRITAMLGSTGRIVSINDQQIGPAITYGPEGHVAVNRTYEAQQWAVGVDYAEGEDGGPPVLPS